jgi:hypothetical protein
MGKVYIPILATLVVNSARAALLRINTGTHWIPHSVMTDDSVIIAKDKAYDTEYLFEIESWALTQKGIKV